MSPQRDYQMFNESSSSHTPRACQTCGTTATSQWRYGHSGKVLLCNACGIRWKRKNKSTEKKRLKPGPKRSRHHLSPPVPQPCPLEPSISTMFYTASATTTGSHNFSSSSSSTDPRVDNYRQREHNSHYHHHHHHHHHHSSSRPKSKMDLDTLMSPADSHASSHGSRRTQHKSRNHSSPISISNLLNFNEDDYTHTSYSKSRHY